MKTQEPMLNASESPRLHAALAIFLTTAFIGVALAGCTETSDSSGKLPSPAKGQQEPVANKPTPPPPPPPPVIVQQESAPATTSVAEPARIAWQQGDKSTAVSRFVEANWSARPLFAPGSTLSLTESEFMLIPSSERNAKANDAMNQAVGLKQLAQAVLQAGHDAAVKKDSTQARKCFKSVKQCGEALDGPDSLLLVRQIGQFLKKMAGKELAKLEQ